MYALISFCKFPHDSAFLTSIKLDLSPFHPPCQNIAQRANREDGEVGKFFHARFRAVRILDDESLLACAAYVDLNPIRAALAETLEQSDFTSVQRRIQSLQQSSDGSLPRIDAVSRDCFLSPLTIDERQDPLGACSHSAGHRCSDKGFLAISLGDYLELLDWTARQTAPGKRGTTPAAAPPIFERLAMSEVTWCELVQNFGRLFYNVAGHPQKIEATRSRQTNRRFHTTSAARALFAATTDA